MRSLEPPATGFADDFGPDRAVGLDVRVLGPLEVRAEGRPVDVGGPRLRALFALLTANLGHVVTVSALVDALWGLDAPDDAQRTARTYISRLRRCLPPAVAGGEAIVTQAAGYQLRLSPDLVDAARFERLAAAARRDLAAGQPDTARDRLAAGLALWRGDAYAEFTQVPDLRVAGERLHQLWLSAVEDHMDAQLATGADDILIGQLVVLTEEHPGHDRLWAQLMTALYRAGRQTEALDTFGRARTALIEQAGLDPSPALTEVHRQVLDHDPRLLALPGPPRLSVVRPAQLPPEPIGFTGRERELAALDETAAHARQHPAAALVCVLSGTAGVGKTSLAMHWAHRVRPEFPGGQLYLNLRGFDPGGTALTPAEAVRSLLDALGVPPAGVPADPQAQAALYRSLLTERRMLLVLDNARDAEQVRPLLGAAGCLTLITSRNQLTSLAVTEGARLLIVDVLDPGQARRLLAHRLGPDRLADDPGAAAEIIDRCAGLPLALAIVAARVAAQPNLPLTVFAGKLRESGRRLDFLDGGDPATQVRTVFAASYRALSPMSARVFRLLGLHPGPDIALPAIAGLSGLSAERARASVAELVRGHLCGEHRPGRYVLHDLLRGYAAELAAEDPDRRAATHRMIDHYLHTAHAADAVLTPQPHPFALPPAQPGAAPERPATHDAAAAWFAAEHPVLVALVEQAAATGFGPAAWQLAATLTTYLDRHGHWRALAAVQATALDAAQRGDDRLGQAYAHRGLGLAEDRLGRPGAAGVHYGLALNLFGTLDNHPGQARTYQHLARMSSARQDYRRAREHARDSLRHYAAADDPAGQSAALNHLGWYSAQLGQYDQALPHCEQALALAVEIGDLNGQAHIWDSLGYIRHHLGQHDRAVDCYRRARELFHSSGERRGEANCLVCLGDAQQAAGQLADARRSWRAAVDIIDQQALPDTATLRAKLLSRLDG